MCHAYEPVLVGGGGEGKEGDNSGKCHGCQVNERKSKWEQFYRNKVWLNFDFSQIASCIYIYVVCCVGWVEIQIEIWKRWCTADTYSKAYKYILVKSINILLSLSTLHQPFHIWLCSYIYILTLCISPFLGEQFDQEIPTFKIVFVGKYILMCGFNNFRDSTHESKSGLCC